MAELYVIIGGPTQLFALVSQIRKCLIRKSTKDLSSILLIQGIILNFLGIFYGIKVNDQLFVFFAATSSLLYLITYILKFIYK